MRRPGARGGNRLTIALAGGALGRGRVRVASAGPTAATSATLYATIETVLTLFALAAAWLLRAHFLQTLRRRDLLMLAGVLTFGLVHLFACAVPAALNASSSGYLAAMNLWGELFVATMFAAAALVPRDQLALTVHHPARAATVVGMLSVAVAAASAAAPMLVDGHGLIRTAGTVHHLPALALAVGTAALFAFTAFAFAREGRPAGDRSCLLLAGGAALLAVAAADRAWRAVRARPRFAHRSVPGARIRIGLRRGHRLGAPGPQAGRARGGDRRAPAASRGTSTMG